MIRPLTIVQAYEGEGRELGLTVAEWERRQGLPKFSVYPGAGKASSFSSRGFFMYRNATDEERAQMDHVRAAKARAGKRAA